MNDITDTRITRERIDELLDFAPLFDPPAAAAQPEFGLDQLMPFAEYPDGVSRFFRAAQQEWWNDYGYSPERSAEMLADPAAVAAASLEQVKMLLTYMCRGERFCDGWWGAMAREGHVAAVLRRLAELRETAQ